MLQMPKSWRQRAERAHLILLPIVDVLFERNPLEIVGSLLHSHSGNQYVLVVCQYATRYPEAIPLCSIKAKRIAEELVKVLTRVRLPKEILTDQGSNFTSCPLAEVFNLLHIKAL